MITNVILNTLHNIWENFPPSFHCDFNVACSCETNIIEYLTVKILQDSRVIFICFNKAAGSNSYWRGRKVFTLCLFSFTVHIAPLVGQSFFVQYCLPDDNVCSPNTPEIKDQNNAENFGMLALIGMLYLIYYVWLKKKESPTRDWRIAENKLPQNMQSKECIGFYSVDLLW